jgi:hypothetical protein
MKDAGTIDDSRVDRMPRFHETQKYIRVRNMSNFMTMFVTKYPMKPLCSPVVHVPIDDGLDLRAN